MSIENLSVTKTLWSKSDSFKHRLLHKFQASIYLIIYIPSTCRVLCFIFPPGRIQGYVLCKIMIFVVSAMKKVVVQRRSAKKIFLKALKNICARVSSYVSLQTNAWIFIKKREYDTDVFPVNFVKFLRKSFSQNTSGECFCHEVSQIAMIKRRNLCKFWGVFWSLFDHSYYLVLYLC